MTADVDILEILNKYGFRKIGRSSDNYTASCIWHSDRNPSFTIHHITGAWNCYSCKRAGPHLISFIAKLENCSDNEAKRKLYGGGEDSDKHYERIAQWARNISFDVPAVPELALPEIPEDIKFKAWRDSAPAKAWLDKNRISDETADFFCLRYCHFGYYFGHVSVPVLDADGKFYTYEFRLADGPGIKGKKVIYPLHSQLATVVYNAHRILPNQSKVILVEGAKDVWSLHQVGGLAVSCFGTHISDKQIRVLMSKGVQAVAVLFDGDDAGRTAAFKVVKKLALWFDVQNHECPPGKDPNDCEPDVLRGILDLIGRS